MTHHYDNPITRITHLTCDATGCTNEYRDDEPDSFGNDMRDRAFKSGWWRGVTKDTQDICPACIEKSNERLDAMKAVKGRVSTEEAQRINQEFVASFDGVELSPAAKRIVDIHVKHYKELMDEVTKPSPVMQAMQEASGRTEFELEIVEGSVVLGPGAPAVMEVSETIDYDTPVQVDPPKKDYSKYRRLTWGEFKSFVDKRLAEKGGGDATKISWIDISHESFDPEDFSTLDITVRVSGNDVEIS